MQERRTAIRVAHLARAQYCASTDLIPRDGRLSNLSERGAGVWTRERHAADERVTLTLVLPGDEEPLTATGVVRWVSDQAVRREWYPLGVEWLPLEATTQFRLQSFLKHQAEASAQQAGGSGRRWWRLEWMARTVWLPIGGLCVMLALLMGIVQMRRESRRLGYTLQQREALIHTLELDRAVLQQQLGAKNNQMAASVQELARLDHEIRQLQGDLQHTEEEASVYKGSYALVAEERERLFDRMQHLQREREELAWKLRLAIRALMTSRADAAPAPQPPTGQQLSLRSGNHGYLVKDGKPTPLQGTATWIRVRWPELDTSVSRRPSDS